MTTNNISYGTQLYLAPNLNVAVTKILAVDNNSNVSYRNISTVNGSNQNLNTTNNVTFNAITTNLITSNALYKSVQIPQSNIAYYTFSITTINAGSTVMITLPTVSNTNYLVYAEVSSRDTGSGAGGTYLQTKMMSNTAGVINNANQLENLSNKSTSLSTSSITISSSGTNIVLLVAGITGRTIVWTAFVRVITVSFV